VYKRRTEHEVASLRNFAFLVRRARLLLGLTQQEFAEHFDVETSTVSRWERGLVKPMPRALAEINKVATRSSPFIVASPVFKYLARLNNLTEPLVISQGVYDYLKAVGYTAEDFLKGNLKHVWTSPKDPVYEVSVLRLLTEIDKDPKWLKGEIAYAEFRGFGKRLNGWARGLAAPLPDKDEVVLVELTPDAWDKSEGTFMRLVPYHFR
jgi:transcriptional regulator with XRE-family HTH domain